MVAVALMLVMGCSKESQSNSEVKSPTADAFLKKFYKTDFDYGNASPLRFRKAMSATSRGEVTYEDLVITEIIVGDDTRARGYMVTGKTTNEFLYFVDVDRDLMKMLTYDVKINETKELKDIDQLQ